MTVQRYSNNIQLTAIKPKLGEHMSQRVPEADKKFTRSYAINTEVEEMRQELMENGVNISYLINKAIKEAYQEEIGQYDKPYKLDYKNPKKKLLSDASESSEQDK